jgi:hypothetical protein
MEEEEILKDPRTTHKNMIRAWNRAAEQYPWWPKHRLGVPVYRNFWGNPWSAVDSALEASVDTFLRAGRDAAVADIFDDAAPTQPLRPTTIRTQKEHLRMAATIVSASGAPSSLADLCRPQAFKLVINNFVERHGKGVTPYIAQMAWTLTKVAGTAVNLGRETSKR